MIAARPDPAMPPTARPKLGIVRQRPDGFAQRDDQAVAMLTAAGLTAVELDDPANLRAMLADMARQAGLAALERDRWQAVTRESVELAKALAGPLAAVAGIGSEAAAMKARIVRLEAERDAANADASHLQALLIHGT